LNSARKSLRSPLCGSIPVDRFQGARGTNPAGPGVRQGYGGSNHAATNPHGKTKPSIFRSRVYLASTSYSRCCKGKMAPKNRWFGPASGRFAAAVWSLTCTIVKFINSVIRSLKLLRVLTSPSRPCVRALPPATRSELYGRCREWRNQAGGPRQKCTLQGKSTFARTST
jgi:hypothetical protein